MSIQKKSIVKSKILGSTAKQTIENFVINQLGSEAEEEFGVSPGAIDMSNVKGVSIHWEDDGEGGIQCRVAVRFEMEGTWSAT